MALTLAWSLFQNSQSRGQLFSVHWTALYAGNVLSSAPGAA